MRVQRNSPATVAMLISTAVIFTAAGYIQNVKGVEQPNQDVTALKQDVAGLKQAFADFKQSELSNEQSISNVSLTATPIGSVAAYSGLVDPTHPLPSDWLACDGEAISKVDYPGLFAALSTVYGDGRDPQGNKLTGTDFNVPDLRGYFLRGVDGGAKRDPDSQLRLAPPNGSAGASVGTVQGEDFKSHGHSISDPGHTHTLPRGFIGDKPGGYGTGGGGGGGDIYDINLQTVPWALTNITGTNNTGGNETRPRNVAVYWIIRAK